MAVEKWAQLEAFVAVIDSGGFTAAARRLGRTPSAVSRQIKALEDRLGARLLNRTTRRVSSTAAGEAFAERTRAILADLDEAEQGVARHQAEPRGRLRLGAPLDFGRAYLAGPLAAFAARHPGLSLDVELTDRLVDVVEEGFDLVVRIADLPDSSLVARRLAPCRRVLCAAPGYLAGAGAIREPADLSRHRGLVYAHSPDARWRFRGPEGPLRVAAQERHRVSNGELLCALAVAGEGLALLPTFLACDDLRAGRLVPVLADQLDEDIAIHAVYPHRRHLSAKVRLLVDDLVAAFGDQPDWDEGWAPGAPGSGAGSRGPGSGC
ncbi:MAG: LysR substrate-binding domain-containing protein [Myxococcota bacterium]